MMDMIKHHLELFERKYEFEIQIVDHCNLKCEGCNHFSNIAEPWLMSEEEFKYSVDILKRQLKDSIRGDLS